MSTQNIQKDEAVYTAAVITMSDKGARGEREDTSGPRLCDTLTQSGYSVTHTKIVPDNIEDIKNELKYCADELKVDFVITTGGTGFTPRDNTPEATMAIIERATPGIAEFLRAESIKKTPNGMLSRGVSGIRAGTLFVNVPGSERAAAECLSFLLPTLSHALKMLRGRNTEH